MRRSLISLVGSMLLACAGTAQVRETVARPRIASSTTPRASTHAQLVPLKSAATFARDAKEPEEEDEPQDFSGIDTVAPKEEAKKAPVREVDVEGIEGTMSEFDVQVALDGRDADFNHCHDEHRGGSGRILFRIHILSNGDVGDVKAHASHVHGRGIVECYTQVVSSTHFSTPHGGYADVKWTTKVGRSRKRADPIYERTHRFDAPTPTKAEASSSGSRRERHHHHHHRSHKHRS